MKKKILVAGGTGYIGSHTTVELQNAGYDVVIIDDLIATGGTVEACAKMIERLGGEVTRIVFLMELAGLKGREKLAKYDVKSVIRYDGK